MPTLIDQLKDWGSLQPSPNFKFVTVNPLADERKLLRRLGIKSADCVVCGVYWVYKNRMYFVNVDCIRDSALVSYHQSRGKFPKHDFYVATLNAPLTTSTIEISLNYLSQWIMDNEVILRSKLKDTHVITREDVCA